MLNPLFGKKQYREKFCSHWGKVAEVWVVTSMNSMSTQTPKWSSKFRNRIPTEGGEVLGRLWPVNSDSTWAGRGSCPQPLDVYDQHVFSDDTSESMLTECLCLALANVRSCFHISTTAGKCFWDVLVAWWKTDICRISPRLFFGTNITAVIIVKPSYN